MDNKDRPAFSNSLSHQDWGVGTQQEVIERNAGLTKLEDFVKHNMPNVVDSLKTVGAYGMSQYDCRINQFEKAQIDKTIAACKYALEKLEEALKKLQHYIETYPEQMNWKEYSEQTFVNDMLYGVGTSVDDSFQYADGFARFRKCIGRFGFDRELLDRPATNGVAEGMSKRERRIKPWEEYPIGTLAHCVTGGCWERVERGWMWQSSGCVFPTPGGDAVDVTVPTTNGSRG